VDGHGVTYKFSPTEAKVERNQTEKTTMTTPNLQKDLAGLLRDVQSQLTDATKLIGTDPAAAMNLLTQAQAAIDVTSNLGLCAKCGTKVEKVATAPEDPILKAIADQTKALEALNANIAKLGTAPATTPGVLPIGDLNSIVPPAAQEDSPLIKALSDGDLQKAFAEVGNDTNKLYEQVGDVSVKKIFEMGINVSRIAPFGLPAQEG
jgi:hypothetical protein